MAAAAKTKRDPTTPLIRHYGLHWDEREVQWSGKGAAQHAILLGKFGGAEYDFGKARGVYALYKDYRLVYVGQASARALGLRLREHRQDHKAGRWNTFSWFSLSLLTAKGLKDPPMFKNVSSKSIIRSFEALAILIADPNLNRQRMRIPGADEIRQIRSKQSDRILESLQRIESTVNTLKDTERRPRSRG